MECLCKILIECYNESLKCVKNKKKWSILSEVKAGLGLALGRDLVNENPRLTRGRVYHIFLSDTIEYYD